MIQIFPALIFGLYTRWFSGTALFVGWAVGMIVGTALSWTPGLPVNVNHMLAWTMPGLGTFDPGLGFSVYNGLSSVVLNVAVAAVAVAGAALARGGPDVAGGLFGHQRGLRLLSSFSGAAREGVIAQQ